MTRIDRLEKDLKQTKQTMGNAIVKLVKKVKKMEKVVKSRRVVLIDSEDEDVSTGFTDIKSASEKVSSDGEHVTPQTKRTKKQIREEQASLAEIARIQAKDEAENARREELKRQDELAAKRLQEELELSEAQKKRIQRRKLIAEQKAKAQRDKPMTQAQQRHMERFVPMDTEKESKKRTGVELQTESSKKLKSDTREDVSIPKEKDKESVKRGEEFEIKKPVLRYTKRKSLARKGLQKKAESAKSVTEEDVEAYMKERVDEPSSEEFPMGSIPQGPAPAKMVKWQIIKTGKREFAKPFLLQFQRMASMKYYDKHNQVGFLKKPKESAGFAEIVDFLKARISGSDQFKGLQFQDNSKNAVHNILKKLIMKTLKET
ncbi:hypothetical protein Tco_1280043 [Tanacetum coccineum]